MLAGNVYVCNILSELGFQLRTWTLNSENALTASVQYVTTTGDDENKYILRNGGRGRHK
jgi:hypothetical protein